MMVVKTKCNVKNRVKVKQKHHKIGKSILYQGFGSILICFFIFFFNSLCVWGAQNTDVIASGDVTVQGVNLQVEPHQQTVPRNTGTVVNTSFTVDNPGLLTGMVVKGELAGPGFKEPLTLTTLPNHPFTIPGIAIKGTYHLENIRLEREGKTLAYAEPQKVEINVMEIIVTKVESRPLSMEEIREKGIVISEENFTAQNFTIGLKIQSEVVNYSFPMVFLGNDNVYIPTIQGAPPITISDPTIEMKFPSTPVPVRFKGIPKPLPDEEYDRQVYQPSVSGVVLFNNDVAFLNQFFSVMFIIANHAPGDSGIALKDLTASITFPDGLREAETNPPHIAGTPIPVRCPGPDGEIGTSDDLEVILATFSGMAEFLAEGLKKGTHIVKIDFQGTLTGLPSGDTPVSGSASGAVIVRNPEFSITFAHPSVIREGEEYDVLVTMTNTSPVTANLASLVMPSTRLIGTTLLSDDTVSFESIEPGESKDALFHMKSKETGQVRATAFESDSNIKGKFVLTVGVGEQGIPLSPDTLVLPEYAYSFPNELINAALRLLGEAYSIATTPAGGLPSHLPIIEKSVVELRALEFARTGQSYSFGDSLFKSLAVLTLDWLGNQTPDINFDRLRRLTSKGLKYAEQQALIFSQELADKNVNEFNLGFAQTCSYKSPFITAALSFPSGNRTAALKITDYYQNRLSNWAGNNNLLREIPYGEMYLLEDSGSSPVDFAVIGHLDEHGYDLEILGTDTGGFDLSLIVPEANGNLRRVEFSGVEVEANTRAKLSLKVTDETFTLYVDIDDDGTTDSEVMGNVTAVPQPPLELISAVQDCEADPYGHATALFFSRPLDKTSAQTIENYSVEGKEIYASFLQPSGRIVLIGTNSPISPFVETRVQVENVMDITGQVLTPSPIEMPIQATTKLNGGVVNGYVKSASGQPITYAVVQLVEKAGESRFISSQTQTDETGFYQFDFVHIFRDPFRIQVQDPETGAVEEVKSRLLGHGQRQEINIIMRGMGSVSGVISDSEGNPLEGAFVVLEAEGASLQGSNIWQGFQAVTGANGQYVIYNVPVGHFNITAYNGKNFGYASGIISAPGELVSLNITLNTIKTASVSGRVFENDGVTPVVETYVNLFGPNKFGKGTQTDDQGYFEFPIVPIGAITIHAYNMNTAKIGGIINTELMEGQHFNATIIFRGNGRVYGKVTDAFGAGMENVLVYLDGTAIYMDTNSNGEFDFPDVPVGNYSVKAISRITGKSIFQSVHVLLEGQESYVSLVFPADNTLRGKISGTVFDTDGMTPMPDVMVQLADKSLILLNNKVYTNELGKFELNDLDVGNYTVFVDHMGKVGVSRFSIQYPGHEITENIAMVGRGKLLVNVFAPDGQTPVKATIILRKLEFINNPGSQIGFAMRESSHSTDDNGFFQMDSDQYVLMGDFIVSASNSFYPRGNSYSGEITTHGEEKTVNLVMRPTGKVIGHVYSWDGTTPVGGATIKFQNHQMNFTQLTAEEGDVGSFELTLIAPGWFQITAEDSVSGLKGIVGGLMGEDAELVEVDVRLKGQGEVNGVVKSPSGDLIPNANIRLETSSYPHERYNTTANENGQFTIYQVWEGNYSISAYDNISHRGGRATGNVSGHNAQSTVEIIVDPIGTIKGHVYSSDGTKEIIDVQVVLYHRSFQYKPIGYAYVSEIGPSGGFLFENVRQGDFYVEAFQPSTGRKGLTHGSLNSEGETAELDIYLEGRGTVKGGFFDGSHIDPIPHASITIKSNGKYPFELTTSTDADGFFEFPEVGKGGFELSATDPDNGLMGTASGTINYDGQTVSQNVYAQGWGQVKGFVLKSDGTTKLANARVQLKQGSRTYTDYTGSDPNAPPEAKAFGEYHFSFVPTGSFSINATDQAGRDHGSTTGNVEFHGHIEQVDVLLTGLGVVKGRVLDGGGNPQAGIPVTLQSGSERFNSVTSNGSDGLSLGEFRFEQVRMGSFSLNAKEPISGLSGSGSGELTQDGQEIIVDLTLESAASITGRIVQSDGSTPAINAEIILSGSNNNQYIYSDANGEFQFTSVRLGPFKLKITGENNQGKALISDELTSHGDIKNLGDIQLDDVRPTVTEFTPIEGSSVVPLNTTITIKFSEPMTLSQINSSTIRLVSSQGNTAGSIQVAPDQQSLVFTPSAPLSSFVLYTIIADQSLTDLSGNTMTGTFTSTFSTVDLEGPQVLGINPADNTRQVSIDSVITINFNEPIDVAALTAANIVLSKGGSTITCSPQWSEGNMKVVLTPAILTTNMVYTLTIQGVKDVLGNTQPQSVTTTFYTTDTVIPTFSSFEPAEGTSVLEGSNTYMTATLTDNDTAKVYFYLNGKYLGYQKYPTSASNGHSFRLGFTAPLISQSGNQYVVEVVAEDLGGNQSERTAVTYNLLPDQPPVVTLTGPGVSTVLPGDTIQCRVSATDDLELSRITMTAIGGTLNYKKDMPLSYAGLTFKYYNFTINIPSDIMPGTEIILHGEAEDKRGNVSSGTDITISVPTDEQGPEIQIISPLSGTHFTHNETVNIEANVTDDLSVKEVKIYWDDQLLETHTSEPYTASYVVPPLDQDQTSEVKVEAEDTSGKISTATVNVVLEKLVDLTAPQVKILSPSTGSLVFRGENLKIKVEATDDEGVSQVEFFVDDQSVATLSESPYEYTHVIPADTVIGSTINIRAVATDVDGKNTEDQVQVEVITGTFLNGGVRLNAEDLDFENQTIIIREGVVEINGAHNFLNVLVKESGMLTHSACTNSTLYQMDISVTGKLVVGCDASVNVTGRGYLGSYRGGNSTQYGITLGNTNTGGSHYTSGGSYGGFGGFNWGYQLGKIYGSIENPRDHGSGGGGYPGSSANYGGSGGGVIMLNTSHIINDGLIISYGHDSSNMGAGSGGSIQIHTSMLSGSGSIGANGGKGITNGSGGGGRVALYYEDASNYDMSKITAYGGVNGRNIIRFQGYCGTVYLKTPNQEAQLILDNNSIETYTRQTYPDLGHSQITSLTANVLTDSTASFMTDSLIGMELIPDINNSTQTFTIIDNDGTTITTDPADGYLNSAAAVGDTFSAIAVFNGHVIIRNNPAAHLHDYVRVNHLSILNNSEIEPKTFSLRNMNYCIMNLEVSGTLHIDATSSINMKAQGYLGSFRGNNNKNFNGKSEYNGTEYGRTLGDTTTGGSFRFSGGSHGGLGGKYGSNAVNECYGSIYLPQDPGSGGGGYNTTSRGGNGGGVLILHATQIQNDGLITVNGLEGELYGGGGSGGSLQVYTAVLRGNGSFTANGGNAESRGAGGGGRIALYYEDAGTYDFNKIQAFGGLSTTANNPAYNGAAGTIYLEQKGLVGEVLIKNGTVNSTQNTPLKFDNAPEGTSGTITALESQRLKDDNAQFVPGSLIGVKVIPNIDHADRTAFTIIDNTATEIFTDPADGDMTQVAAVGDQYGLKHPAKLVIDGSQFEADGILSFQELSLSNGALTLDGTIEINRFELTASQLTLSGSTQTLSITLNNNSQLNVSGSINAGSIISANSQITMTGNADVGPFSLDNSHLTLNGSLEVETLTLQSGSEITHSVNTSSATYSMQINAGEIVINEGNSIHANNCGYLGGQQGDNNSSNGRTMGNNNLIGSIYNSGGSHGGFGGYASQIESVNQLYGHFEYPTDPGSGGGGYGSTSTGGNGGGVVVIHATELTNNGQISCNGQPVSNGGGAGGSIQLHTQILQGSGGISANGGDSSGYGAGGGGRIAVYYENASAFDLNKITAYGGATSNTNTNYRASAGTVYLKAADLEGQLIIDNNNIETPARMIFPSIGKRTISHLSPNRVLLADGETPFMAGSLKGMELIPNINNKSQTFTIVDNDSYGISTDPADGDLTAVASEGDTYDVKAVVIGHLIIRNHSSVLLNSESQFENLSILQNSDVEQVPTTMQKVAYLSLTINNRLTIDSTSSVDADGLGYLGGSQDGNYSSDGCTLGNSVTGGSGEYSGGSYGGLGGQYNSNNVNVVYGSLYEPLLPGSGGGHQYELPGASEGTVSNNGGNGGGVIIIHTSEISNDGRISSNGQSAVSGAGSGGSLQIHTTTLSGSGTISVNGGDSQNGGGGGGGRVALYYEVASGFNLNNITAYGGTGSGGTDANLMGGAGTVYLKASTNTLGSLIMNNNNRASRENSSPLPAVGQGFSTLLESSKMTNTAARFVPNALMGMKLNPQMAAGNLFTITSNTGTEIFTHPDDGDMTQVSSTGSPYIGEHLLFNLTIKGGARLFTLDRVQISGTLTIEPGSTLTAENHQ